MHVGTYMCTFTHIHTQTQRGLEKSRWSEEKLFTYIEARMDLHPISQKSCRHQEYVVSYLKGLKDQATHGILSLAFLKSACARGGQRDLHRFSLSSMGSEMDLRAPGLRAMSPTQLLTGSLIN